MTDLDKQVSKIVGVLEKRKTYSGVDGGRSITYRFNTRKAVNAIKKNLKAKLPTTSNLKVVVTE